MQDLHLPNIIPQPNRENLELLPKSLTNNSISLGQLKNGLFKYYKSALKDVFDVDNPRTWKSICLSCNGSYTELKRAQDALSNAQERHN